MRNKNFFIPAVVVAALAVPVAPALADNPATTGYEESGGVLGEVLGGGQPPATPQQEQQAPAPGQQNGGNEVLGERQSGGGNEVLGENASGGNAPAASNNAPAPAAATAARPAASSGELPFTGYDVGIVLAMGLALLGAGLLLKRTQAQRS